MGNYGYYKYLEISGEKLFTLILLPQEKGGFPTVIFRSPYVNDTINKSETELFQNALFPFKTWLMGGCAIVYQHCKGTDKSSVDFVFYCIIRQNVL